MIRQEDFDFEGRTLRRTWSDAGFLVRNVAGDLYGEAVDPAEFNRQYTETDIPADTEESADASEEDYMDALNDLGVNTGEEEDA